MKYLICVVPVMPLRLRPSDSSEMISQLLFGEAMLLLEKGPKDWIRIRNQYDKYEGWASLKQLEFIKEHLYNDPTREYTSEFTMKVQSGGHPMHLPMGSFLKGMSFKRMKWGKIKTIYKGTPFKPDFEEVSDKQIKNLAYEFLNVPYLWGGRSVYGIDCSGFTQTMFRLLGKRLPRDTRQQVQEGELLNEDEQPKSGDLAFFQNEEGKIMHVGLMLNHFEIIHASGKVRLDRLDKKGIFKAKNKEYSHLLHSIRRFR
ncbi:MAG TPA: C40 family peptidase [Chitinophagaceae bacterium]|nr:C40 family peptidase [Chitinophagaceae bacterium]